MLVIFKYNSTVRTGRVQIEMPRNAKPLSIGMQHGQVQVYALVDNEEKETDTFIFHYMYTGWPLPISFGPMNTPKFLGTVMDPTGLVTHVFFNGN